MKNTKVAIVHDWIYGGGAERVVEQLHKMYPDAPIYTSYCSPEWRKQLDNKVVTGYLQHWPLSKLRKFLPVLRQHWFSHLDLSQFDLVISSSGNGEAKFARVAPNATHVCYCFTPTHFYWDKYQEYIKNPSFKPKWLARLGLKLLVGPLRKRDYAAAQKVDHFIAISTHIQDDIKQYYGRDSVVVHPPVDIERFRAQVLASKRGSFITWGRHVPYKRFDIIIEACNQLNLPLVVVGDGPETAKLKKISGDTIKFVGHVTDEQLVHLSAGASGFIFAAVEDFGIAPVEAMAAGLPTIAYKSGGALDYLVPGETGEFFDDQTTESLVKALKSFNPSKYNPSEIKAEASKFSNDNFIKNLTTELARYNS